MKPFFLLIDDEPWTNLFHQKLIQKMGYSNACYVAEHGKKAIDYLTKCIDFAWLDKSYIWPNIILLDLNMPLMDGWEFLSEYEKFPLEYRNKTKVVLLTSSPDPDDLEKTKEKSFIFKYLKKPINLEVFSQLLANISQELDG